MTLNPLTIVRRAFANAARNGITDFIQEMVTDDAIQVQLAEILTPKLAAITNGTVGTVLPENADDLAAELEAERRAPKKRK